MASNAAIKGITIKIEGDTSPLAKDLQNINKDIGQTSKALKDVEQALKLDPSNVELLAAKQELLNKQIEQTNTKLELEKQAGEDAKRALELGDITQEEYATLQAEIAKTESTLGTLQDTASGASDELSATGDAAKDAGDKASESNEAFINWGEVVAGAADVAWTAIQAVTSAIADAATALADMTRETASYADDVLTLSQVSGVATDTLQALQYGEDLLDVSAETVSGAITKLIKSMSAAEGAEASYLDSINEITEAYNDGEITLTEYQDAIDELGSNSGTAFAELGVNILDASGNLRDSEDVFWDVIDALGEIDNETERDAAAMNILGRSARSLNPLIEAGAEGFEAVREEAEAAGAIMSGDTLRSFQQYDDTLSRLDQGAQAAQRALGGILLPVLNDLGTSGVDLLNNFTTSLLESDGDLSQFGDIVAEMVAGVQTMIDESLPEILEIGGTILQALVDGISSNLDSILTVAIDVVLTVAQGIIDNLESLAPVAADLIVRLVDFIINNLAPIMNAAIQIIVAIVRGISAHLPELIPAAVSAVTEIVTALIDNVDLLIPAAAELIVSLALGLVAAIPELLAVVPEIIDALGNEIADLGTSLTASALEWGGDMIDSFVNGIRNAMGHLTSAVSDIAGTIASYLHFSVPDIGPLADFDESGGDMIDEFINGMQGQDYELQRALYNTGNIIYNGMTSTDYSGALSGISAQLAGLGDVKLAANIYIGGNRVGTQIVDLLAQNDYRTGGI